MSRRFWRQTGALVFALGSPCVAQSAQSNPAAQYKPLLDRYCVTCHNQRLKTADLTLDKMDVNNVPAGAEVWEKVIHKLRGRAMPPPKLPRPDNATIDAFASYLETSLDKAAALKPNPGRPAAHRLNRAEYANAVRDLLAVDVDAESILPADDSGFGFDNIGDVLSVSPTLLERYLGAARRISRIAVGDPAMRPVSEAYEVPDDLIQEDRMSEELPLGSRGGISIHHNFPADGEYVIKVRLKRDGDRTNGEGNPIRGVGLKRKLDIRMDDERLKLFPVGGEHFGQATQGVFGVEVYDVADPKQDAYERGRRRCRFGNSLPRESWSAPGFGRVPRGAELGTRRRFSWSHERPAWRKTSRALGGAGEHQRPI